MADTALAAVQEACLQVSMNPGLRKSDLVCVNANHFLSTEPFLYSPFANRCVGGFFLFFIAIASLPLQSSPELQLIPSKKEAPEITFAVEIMPPEFSIYFAPAVNHPIH